MSIQAQIDRIEQVKADICTSIAGKGVSVPSGTQLDVLPALIDQIATGGSNIPATITAGDTPIAASWTGKKVSSTTVTDTGLSLTMDKAGTYRFRVPAAVVSSFTTSNPTVYLYKNGTQAASQSVSSSTVSPLSFDLECAAGDVIAVYAAGAGSSYTTTAVAVLSLVACIDWDNGF